MAEDGMGRRLLALASTSLLAGIRTSGTSTSVEELLERTTPGYGFLQEFFASWLKVDIATLAAALTIFGTISGALGDLKGVALKIYWWFTRLFTASISIASSDRLNREVLNWLGAQVLTRQETRVLTARTEALTTDAWQQNTVTERDDYSHGKRVPIQYLPTFGSTWFIHARNVFLVRRIPTNRFPISKEVPEEYAAAPEGDEPLVVMCLGRSVSPIKRFLDDCRDFAEQQRKAFITVRSSKNIPYSNESWDTTILRPIRCMETVHFDETTKCELVADIKNYLDVDTRKFYASRGIPYRRGYLFHGTYGTGKSSLALALAGMFQLELYLLHLPSVRQDSDLEKLFSTLPPQCILLLEDIDAVGMKRRLDVIDEEEENEEEEREENRQHQSCCTLAGLLNVLDGVASQEGRIVLMTTNRIHKLDSALIRPGRIDKKIFLGNISQRNAELMFLRMYALETSTALLLSKHEPGGGDLEKMASHFSSCIPEDTLTPAQVQGYLLNYRDSPAKAVAGVAEWVAEETVKLEEAEVRAKKAAEFRLKKRQMKTLKALRDLPDGDEIEAQLEELEAAAVADDPTVPVDTNKSPSILENGENQTQGGKLSNNHETQEHEIGTPRKEVDL